MAAPFPPEERDLWITGMRLDCTAHIRLRSDGLAAERIPVMGSSLGAVLIGQRLPYFYFAEATVGMAPNRVVLWRHEDYGLSPVTSNADAILRMRGGGR